MTFRRSKFFFKIRLFKIQTPRDFIHNSALVFRFGVVNLVIVNARKITPEPRWVTFTRADGGWVNKSSGANSPELEGGNPERSLQRPSGLPGGLNVHVLQAFVGRALGVQPYQQTIAERREVYARLPKRQIGESAR